jgi:hypothetical protein
VLQPGWVELQPAGTASHWVDVHVTFWHVPPVSVPSPVQLTSHAHELPQSTS